MSAKEFAAQLRETIAGMKKEGTAAIYVDVLIEYLDKVIASPTTPISSAELEQFRADLQLHVARYQAQIDSDLEMFRSVITAGQSAMRASFLLNGGAAVALLAFIGKLTDTQHDKIAPFAESLMPFVVGVLAITVTSGATYLGQYCWSDGHNKSGHILNFLAIILGLSSYGFFVWGMTRAWRGFLAF